MSVSDDLNKCTSERSLQSDTTPRGVETRVQTKRNWPFPKSNQVVFKLSQSNLDLDEGREALHVARRHKREGLSAADTKGYLVHLAEARGAVTKCWYPMTWDNCVNLLVVR